MYVWSAALREAKRHLEDAKSAFTAGAVLGAIGLGPASAVMIWAGGDDLQLVLQQLPREGNSLYWLSPIEDRFQPPHPQIDVGWVQSSGIEMLMGVVGLTSGRLRYVDSQGRLFNRDAPTVPIAGPVISLVDGVIASAAIPAVFQAKSFMGELQVDGGVREILPLAAAVQRGAERIFAILASPAYREDIQYNFGEELAADEADTPHQKAPGGILEIIERSLDLLTDEITLSNTQVASRRGPLTYLIRPWFEVHGTTVIDPGLIRINIDYGHMKAFDVTTSSVRSERRRARLTALADSITKKRTQAWHLELKLTVMRPRERSQTDLDRLARLKCEIRDLVSRRRAVGGERSMPPESEAWWTQLEHHSDQVILKAFTDRLERVGVGTGLPPDLPLYTESSTSQRDQLTGELLPTIGDCPAPGLHPEDRHYFVDTIGSGFFQPSTNGGIGDFELLVPQGPQLVHYRRANDEPGAPWQYVGVAFDASASTGGTFQTGMSQNLSGDPGVWPASAQREHWPEAVSFFQGNYGIPGNLEAVIQIRPGADEPNAERGSRLFATWFDSERRRWATAYEIQATFTTRGGLTTYPITGVTRGP